MGVGLACHQIHERDGVPPGHSLLYGALWFARLFNRLAVRFRLAAASDGAAFAGHRLCRIHGAIADRGGLSLHAGLTIGAVVLRAIALGFGF